jgi:hypothetical protein
MPCEKCGYCKECGRSNQDQLKGNQWAPQVQPSWPVPTWDGSWTCFQCGKKVGMYEVHPCYPPSFTYISTATVFPEVS